MQAIRNVEVDTKVNILALTSFALSLIALGNQFFGYIRGAEVEIHAPQSVVLRVVVYPSALDKYFLVVEAPMTYTNTGAAGYSAIVDREIVAFTLADRPRQLMAYTHFVDVDDRKTRIGVDPEYRGSEQAGPKVVPAQGALTHWSAYQPLSIDCDSRPDPTCDPTVNSIEFSESTLKLLKDASRLNLIFSAVVVGQKKPLTVSCRLNGTHIDLPTLKERGFQALACYKQVTNT